MFFYSFKEANPFSTLSNHQLMFPSLQTKWRSSHGSQSAELSSGRDEGHLRSVQLRGTAGARGLPRQGHQRPARHVHPSRQRLPHQHRLRLPGRQHGYPAGVDPHLRAGHHRHGLHQGRHHRSPAAAGDDPAGEGRSGPGDDERRQDPADPGLPVEHQGRPHDRQRQLGRRSARQPGSPEQRHAGLRPQGRPRQDGGLPPGRDRHRAQHGLPVREALPQPAPAERGHRQPERPARTRRPGRTGAALQRPGRRGLTLLEPLTILFG